MKTLGLVILMLGVALSALFGARNPEAIDTRTTARGRVAMLSLQEAGAWTAVCAALPSIPTGEDGAPDPAACEPARPALPATIAAADSLDLKVLRTRDWVRVHRAAIGEPDAVAAYLTFLQRSSAAREAQARAAAHAQEAAEGKQSGELAPEDQALLGARDEAWAAVCRASDEPLEHCAALVPDAALGLAAAADAKPLVDWTALDAPQKDALGAWFGAAGALHEAKLELGAVETPKPGARFAGWFGVAGIPFLCGIALIVVGGVLVRRADTQAAQGTDKASKKKDAAGAGALRDLGVVFDTLATRSRELADEIGDAQQLDAAQRDAIKAAIDALHTDEIEPVVESRGRIQVRYGMAGFAALFGPLSAGERKLNRAWSALVDAHPPEAQASLAAAAESFAHARAELDALAGKS